MMTARFVTPFDRLDLKIHQHEELHATASALVDEVQALFEAYLFQDHSTINTDKWEFMRAQDDVRVYKDRRPGAGTQNESMHLLLTVGTVLGSLNDAMFGVLNHTMDAMRIKAAYVHDPLVDCAVLETLLEPELNDPFQSMTVRWRVQGVPWHVRPFSSNRDTVVLETTGMKLLANGESVGYHLMHSMPFPTTPALSKYNRFHLSNCTFWRQATPHRVEAFSRTFVEIHQSFVSGAILQSTIDSCISLWRIMECAQMKKLAHLAARKASPAVLEGDDDYRNSEQPVDGCHLCGNTLPSWSWWCPSKVKCTICSSIVCKKCRVVRTFAMFTPSNRVRKHARHVCVACVTSASRCDAATVAQNDVTGSRRTPLPFFFAGGGGGDTALTSMSSSPMLMSEGTRLIYLTLSPLKTWKGFK